MRGNASAYSTADDGVRPRLPLNIPIEPLRPVRGRPQPFDCSRNAVRHPRETKGRTYRATKTSGDNGGCDPAAGCC